MITRREWLAGVAGGWACATLPGLGQEATQEKSPLGIVIYCLGLKRRALKLADPQHDLFRPFAFLEYCRSLGAGGIQVALGVLPDQEAERLRDRAAEVGMFLEAIVAPPRQDSDVSRFDAEIKTAARAGAVAVRTVVFPGRRYERFQSLDEFDRFAVLAHEALVRAVPVVERHRVRLAVENHKDQRLDERLALLESISSEYVGACVDTGNSFALMEDPNDVVNALAPWAFSVHLKDQAVDEYEDGFLFADVALGDGFLDLKGMVQRLRRANPGIHFCLETITRDPLKVPCLAESYWASFRDVPATDLARTLRTVRAHRTDELPRMSGLPLDRQVSIEDQTVRRGLAYARTDLLSDRTR